MTSFFNRIFIIIPLSVAVALGIAYIAGGWGFLFPGYAPDHFLLPELHEYIFYCIVVIVVLFCLAVYSSFFQFNNNYDNEIVTSRKKQLLTMTILSFVFAVLVRGILVYIFRNNLIPFSDFQSTWELSHDIFKGNIEYYTLFPAYLNYSVIQRILISAFGDSYKYIVFFNVALCGVISVSIYLISQLITDDNGISLLAAILYTIMPSGVFYTLIGGPDYLAIALNTLGLLIITISFKTNGMGRYIEGVIGGLLLGMGGSYKPFAVIILIAVVMSSVARAIYAQDKKSLNKHGVITVLVLTAVFIGTVYAGYEAAGTAIIRQTEKVYNVEIHPSSATPHFLLVGLNTQGEGQIHEGDLAREYYQQYLATGDFESSKQYAFELLKKDWRQNPDAIPKLFIKKIVWAWQDDVVPSLYFKDSISGLSGNQLSNLYFRLCHYGPGISQVYYLILMILAVAGSIGYAKKHKTNADLDLIELIIFGFFCLMLISEAQSRYKSLIMPYICILAGMGAREIYRLCKGEKPNE